MATFLQLLKNEFKLFFVLLWGFFLSLTSFATTPFPLHIQPEFHAPPGHGYQRANWLHWIDTDSDCQNTRHEVLEAQSRIAVQRSKNGCKVLRGEWRCPYTGTLFFRSWDLEIDHVVPLAEAYESGANKWSKLKKMAFANDRGSGELLAVSKQANQAKGKRDPAAWLPPDKHAWCGYVKRWVSVKQKWGLSADQLEAQVSQHILSTCPKAAVLH